MSEFYPIVIGLIFIGLLGGAVTLFLKAFNPLWWRKLWIKRAVGITTAVGGIAIICWALGMAYGIRLLLAFGATTAALTIIVLIALILSLPVSGLIHGISWIIKKILQKHQLAEIHSINQNRRYFLKTAAAAIPSITVLAGAGGFGESFASTNIPRIPMTYPDLPQDLRGLKILQISDCHLGFYVGLSALEDLLKDADELRPDLVLVTGDLADDLNLLPEALKLISQVRTKYGAYSSLGNHEYYRGITKVIEIYKNGPIPLLVNEGQLIPIANFKIYIGGADDPRHLRRDNTDFFENTVVRAMAQMPSNSFSILMSHRPEAFDFAAQQGIKLTLSGHTHGGQIGFAGRSVFEPLLSYKYLWGKYFHANGSQLYTTAGVGHWFPFRLGCSSEAPLIILE
jgi:predicted MPP superfamily phosphohydrolase